LSLYSENLVSNLAFKCKLYRYFSEGEVPTPRTDVFLIDAVGILPEAYAAARARPAFVVGRCTLTPPDP
jgi:3-deoxy-D-manno-octulosonic-acid transferase